jgi:hypothetical protein
MMQTPSYVPGAEYSSGIPMLPEDKTHIYHTECKSTLALCNFILLHVLSLCSLQQIYDSYKSRTRLGK